MRLADDEVGWWWGDIKIRFSDDYVGWWWGDIKIGLLMMRRY